MKKLMLLFGLVAFLGASNLSYAADNSAEVIVLDCDKCKDHKCDDKCKKEGCSAEKCAAAHKEGTAEKKQCTKGESKACCKKGGEGTASASGKSCCKKGSSASCDKKKEGGAEEK